MTISHEFLLTLKEWKGFGPKNIQAVAEYLSTSSIKTLTPQEYIDIIADVKQLGHLKRVKELPSKSFISEAYRRALQALEQSDDLGIHFVSRFDNDFPEKLLNTVNEDGKPDVPLFLFYKGSLTATSGATVAVIGTREPSIEGEKAGRYISSRLAEKGVSIVSGMALGCDTSGHRGALDVEGGRTVAFLAHGLDTVYPPQNEALAEEIVANGGILMSEYPVGSGIDRYKLVARDRFQAALADTVIVVQTGITGGTMHAVNAALSVGKPVYALEYKGYINHDKISGNSYLIEKRGAIGLRGDEIDSFISKVCQKPPQPVAKRHEGKVIEPTLFD